jgi:hypothetical protein
MSISSGIQKAARQLNRGALRRRNARAGDGSPPRVQRTEDPCRLRVGTRFPEGTPKGTRRAFLSECRRSSAAHSRWSSRNAELGSNPTRGTYRRR